MRNRTVYPLVRLFLRSQRLSATFLHTVSAEEEEYREPVRNQDAFEVDVRKRRRGVPYGVVIKYEVRRLK